MCTVIPGGRLGLVEVGGAVVGGALEAGALGGAVTLAGSEPVAPARGVPRSLLRPTTQLTASSTTTRARTAIAAAGHFGAVFVALRVTSRTGSPIVLIGVTDSFGSDR